MRIPITTAITFDTEELEERFVRASGPGGQNVNKVSTAVQMRLDLRREGSLPGWVRARAMALGGRRVSSDGVLTIFADRFRSQERNRQDALERVIALLREAAHRPAVRRPTAPTKASVRRRGEAKGQRSAVKQMRRRPEPD